MAKPAKLKLRNKDLAALGYPKGKVMTLAITLLYENFKREPRAWTLDMLRQVRANPEAYRGVEVWGRIARALLGEQDIKTGGGRYELNTTSHPFERYGDEHIDAGARHQMYVAMRLPISVAGALMPDAHHGYGLPIGGVLATDRAVIPYGVGVDIGCRMCLSVFDVPSQQLDTQRDPFKKLLLEHSRFGSEAFRDPFDDAIFSHEAFQMLPIARQQRDKAFRQIGSSGSGNHFVEFGEVVISQSSPQLGLAPGRYLGLLSHSGSRSLGAAIAQHYTQIAMNQCRLPAEARQLAWLSLESQEGQEYWMGMNLAGDYASACHHHIHRRIAQALGESPLCRVENHHNFAWKETLANGQEVIVHRKGATPAGVGVLGIIPGSMSSPGYIVSGRGEAAALNSASHGAGRLMSRTVAKQRISRSTLQQHLHEKGVSLLGGDLDEAPMAYKDIHAVMAAQQSLVDILGTFHPKVVRMDGNSFRDCSKAQD